LNCLVLGAIGFSVALAGFAFGCGGATDAEALADKDSGPQEGGLQDSGSPEGGPRDGDVFDAAPSPDATGDETPAPWSPLCPDALPSTGSACALPEGTQCEYGSAWWSVACDAVVKCASGQWATQLSGDTCSPEPGPNAASCPADFASVPQGSACPTKALACIYAQGACSCQAGPGPSIDGGTANWSCLPEPGCPFPRPRIGTACNQGSCTYSTCEFLENCDNGTWQGQEEACAQGGGPGAHP
jgi:hypothetical protein